MKARTLTSSSVAARRMGATTHVPTTPIARRIPTATRSGPDCDRMKITTPTTIAAAAAIVVGVVIFILSQSGPLRVAVGILLAIGVVGTWVVAPIRRAATELLVRVLAFIHDQT